MRFELWSYTHLIIVRTDEYNDNGYCRKGHIYISRLSHVVCKHVNTWTQLLEEILQLAYNSWCIFTSSNIAAKYLEIEIILASYNGYITMSTGIVLSHAHMSYQLLAGGGFSYLLWFSSYLFYCGTFYLRGGAWIYKLMVIFFNLLCY